MNEKTKLPECANTPEGEFTAEEVVKSLRICHEPSIKDCDSCACSEGHCSDLEVIAADLIEAQGKRIRELEELVEDRTKDVLFYVEREKWIPATERLPELTEEEKRRIIGDDYAAPEFIVMIKGAKKSTVLHFDGEYWYDSEGVVYTVTHWKTMPEGPEVGHE